MNIKIFTDIVEDAAIEQIYTLSRLPAFENCKIRIMPDVHSGAGCVIGFTANLGDKVIPNIVGVDIGCGMFCVELGKINVNFEELDNAIRANVPSGRAVRSNAIPAGTDIIEKIYCKRFLKNMEWLENSMATLGGGNHFCEIDADEEGNKYLVIHTGSRNLGKQVAEYYQNLAIDNNLRQVDERSNLINALKKQGRQAEISTLLKEFKKNAQPKTPRDLCYLEGDDREAYLHDMKLCQEFARLNREYIAIEICGAMKWRVRGGFHTVHNYIDDHNMVRKGAISARWGERLLIPINMRDGCILGVGLGNEEWNCSAPHGAGRLMSRSAAKEKIDLDDFKSSMSGIYSSCINASTIDESPMAYKPIESIISNIKDTVKIEKIIKPIYNFKASD